MYIAKMRPHVRGNCWQWTWTPAGTFESLTCCCLVHQEYAPTFLSWQMFAPDPLPFSMIAFMLWPREQPNISYTSLNVHYKSLPDCLCFTVCRVTVSLKYRAWSYYFIMGPLGKPKPLCTKASLWILQLCPD